MAPPRAEGWVALSGWEAEKWAAEGSAKLV
jgi:hypothetical protein